jgi:hypothetical protein
MKQTLGAENSKNQSLKKQSLQKCKPQIPKGVPGRAQKIEKAEPEKIHTLGAEKCRNRSPKNKKSGARKDTHLGYREMQKLEPER